MINLLHSGFRQFSHLKDASVLIYRLPFSIFPSSASFLGVYLLKKQGFFSVGFPAFCRLLIASSFLVFFTISVSHISCKLVVWSRLEARSDSLARVHHTKCYVLLWQHFRRHMCLLVSSFVRLRLISGFRCCQHDLSIIKFPQALQKPLMVIA